MPRQVLEATARTAPSACPSSAGRASTRMNVGERVRVVDRKGRRVVHREVEPRRRRARARRPARRRRTTARGRRASESGLNRRRGVGETDGRRIHARLREQPAREPRGERRVAGRSSPRRRPRTSRARRRPWCACRAPSGRFCCARVARLDRRECRRRCRRCPASSVGSLRSNSMRSSSNLGQQRPRGHEIRVFVAFGEPVVDDARARPRAPGARPDVHCSSRASEVAARSSNDRACCWRAYVERQRAGCPRAAASVAAPAATARRARGAARREPALRSCARRARSLRRPPPGLRRRARREAAHRPAATGTSCASAPSGARAAQPRLALQLRDALGGAALRARSPSPGTPRRPLGLLRELVLRAERDDLVAERDRLGGFAAIQVHALRDDQREDAASPAGAAIGRARSSRGCARAPRSGYPSAQSGRPTSRAPPCPGSMPNIVVVGLVLRRDRGARAPARAAGSTRRSRR